MQNLAALRAAICLLSAKNRWGAHMCPPGRARFNGVFRARVSCLDPGLFFVLANAINSLFVGLNHIWGDST